MNEAEFLNAIDCRFPYHDEAQGWTIIQQGHAISDNAAFGVLHEIARKPATSTVSAQAQLALLAAWGQANTHPLKLQIMEAAAALITNKPLSIERVLEVMRQVRPYRNQYAAIGIAYFACDDVAGRADELWQEIIDSWQAE